MTDLLVIAAVAVIGGALLLSPVLRYWPQIVHFVMVLMVYEGALRKWILPGFQRELYLLKDALLLLAIAGFAQSSIRPQRGLTSAMNFLVGVLLVSMLYFWLQLANPNLPSPVLGLVGLKNYILYTSLVFLVPYSFRSSDDLDRKMNLYALAMIPVCLLGLVQFAAPQDSWINVYVQNDPDQDNRAVTFGGEADRVRTTGTFSYIGGFSTFLPVMISLGLAYVLAGRTSIMQNLFPLGLLFSASLALFTTGSRGPVYFLAMLLPLVLALSLHHRLVSAVTCLRLVAVSAIGVVGILYLSSDALTAYSHRANNADDPIMRLLSPLTEFMAAFDVSPFIGTGMGTTHGAAASIMGTKDYWWLNGHMFEVEQARVLQEVGPIGFVLTYLPRVFLVAAAIQMVGRLRTPFFKALAAVIAGQCIQGLIVPLTTNPTAALYYWFGAGLLFAMYRLDYQQAQVPLGQRYASAQLYRGPAPRS